MHLQIHMERNISSKMIENSHGYLTIIQQLDNNIHSCSLSQLTNPEEQKLPWCEMISLSIKIKIDNWFAFPPALLTP